MLTRSAFFVGTLILLSFAAAAQDPYVISGKIFDSTNNQRLGAASIRIKGTSSGTVAAEDGSFQLKTTHKLPLTLVVTSVGYKAQEFTISEQGPAGITLSLWLLLDADVRSLGARTGAD